MSSFHLIGLLGILVGLGILIWFAFKGWSVLLLAPIAAVVAALFGGEPFRALDGNSRPWTQTFMRSEQDSSPSSSRCSCSAPCPAS